MTELKKGTDHEMEHTSSRGRARKIAKFAKALNRQKGAASKLLHSLKGPKKLSPHNGMRHADLVTIPSWRSV